MKEKNKYLRYILIGLCFSSIVLLLFSSVNLESIKANEEAFIVELENYLKEEPNLNGAIVGISVRHQQTGQLLYEHNGNVRLRPASNLKLLTAATALSILGENYRFKTELYTDGRIVDNTLVGNLYLKGKGDPTLLPIDFENLVSQLTKKDIKKVNGNIIADDTWYDDIRYSQDLPWTDEQEYYGAQVSALTASPDSDYDAGTVIVQIKGGEKVNEKANITLLPETSYVKIINETKTVNSNEKMDLTYKRNHGTNYIVIEGTIPIHKQEKEWVAVWNPTKYAATLFAESLEKKGISFKGQLIRGKTPNNAKLLVKHESAPLSTLMNPFMKLSNNGHGELLVKEMGRVIKNEGSWEKGLEVLDEQLKSFGINTDSLVLRDGSGISHVNLVPANEITKLLFQVQKEEWFPTFRESLPIAGMEERMLGGTLRYRMNIPPLKGNVYAKTGTISTVSSLSGYIETVNGDKLIFSIMLNNLIDEEVGKIIEDNIVKMLANH